MCYLVQTPGHVFKNKKMPGHMGNTTITTQNLRVSTTYKSNNLRKPCGRACQNRSCHAFYGMYWFLLVFLLACIRLVMRCGMLYVICYTLYVCFNQVYKIDYQRDLLFLIGAVPGYKG